jgi:tRNA threonylcarbamoyladenosine biosynthesis protein TsaE
MQEPLLRLERISLQELPKAAQKILLMWKVPVLLLRGEMGAGKTTFVSALLKQLGSKDSVSSPTFSLVNEYLLPNGEILFHFDLYRLKSEDEALQMGLENYLFSGAKCVIEWPEKFINFMPEKVHDLHIEQNGETRTLTFQTLEI